jgi:hypothetical protein
MKEKEAKARLKTRLDGWQAYLTAEPPLESVPATAAEVLTGVATKETEEAPLVPPVIPMVSELPETPACSTTASVIDAPASETKDTSTTTVPPPLPTDDLFAGGIAAYLDTLSQERARRRRTETVQADQMAQASDHPVAASLPVDKHSGQNEEPILPPYASPPPSVEPEWQKQGLRKRVVFLSLILAFLAGLSLFFLSMLPGK